MNFETVITNFRKLEPDKQILYYIKILEFVLPKQVKTEVDNKSIVEVNLSPEAAKELHKEILSEI